MGIGADSVAPQDGIGGGRVNEEGCVTVALSDEVLDVVGQQPHTKPRPVALLLNERNRITALVDFGDVDRRPWSRR